MQAITVTQLLSGFLQPSVSGKRWNVSAQPVMPGIDVNASETMRNEIILERARIDQRIAVIRNERDKCAIKISEIASHGPEISFEHQRRIVTGLLMTFASLFKLAVHIRGDFDSIPQATLGIASAELTAILVDINSKAMNGEKLSEDGLDTISKITRELMELRGTAIEDLKKNVNESQENAHAQIDKSRGQIAVLQDVLDQARKSLAIDQATLANSEELLRKSVESRAEIQTVKAVSWLFPAIGGSFFIADKIFDFEKGLRDNIAQLHNNIQQQIASATYWQSAISDSEASISALSNAIEFCDHATRDLNRLQTNCDEIIHQSQQTEKRLIQLKASMRELFRTAEIILARSQDADHVTDKAEFIDIILNVLGLGLIDPELFGEAQMVVDELKAGDDTGLLSQSALAEKLAGLGAMGVRV